jgi:hypothetical protein
MDEIPSGNLRSHPTVRLVGESRALNALPLGFSVSSWAAKKLDRRSSRSMGVSGPLIFPRLGRCGRMHG